MRGARARALLIPCLAACVAALARLAASQGAAGLGAAWQRQSTSAQPEARSHHASASANGRLYVHSGYSYYYRDCLDDVWALDVDGGSWERLGEGAAAPGAPGAPARRVWSALGAAPNDPSEALYLFGGYRCALLSVASLSGTLGDLWRFAGGTWKQVRDRNSAPSWRPRHALPRGAA